MDDESDDCEDEFKRRMRIKTTQKTAGRITYYISHDFLALIFFMIIYRKYPYQLAYMRIYDTMDFLRRITCKNKEKFIVDDLFLGIEDEEGARRWIDHYYDFLTTEEQSMYYARYQKQVYIYPKRKNGFIFKEAPKNVVIFRKLVEKCLFGDLDNDIDFWHSACERLFLNRKNFNNLGPGCALLEFDFEKIAYGHDEKKVYNLDK